MTGRDQARPSSTGPGRPRSGRDERRERRDQSAATLAQLGQRLRAAREARGIDLLRAERDTKIRRHYLEALERGDADALPGTVYSTGFLRNYGKYLGLDPADLLAEWHRAVGDTTPAPASLVPVAVEAPSQGFTFSPGIVVAALLILVLVAFGIYLAVQLTRFVEPPTVTVTDPATAVVEVAEDTSAYALRGSTSAGAQVTVRAPGRDEIQVTAGPDGSWQTTVELRRGENPFEISAVDPATGKTSAEPIAIVITVPSSPIEAPALTLDSPAEGVTVENGAIPVKGTATNATEVAVSASYLGPAPGQPPPEATPRAPAPVTLPVGDDGAFSGRIDLTAGTWRLTVTARGLGDLTTTLTRTVTVVYKGLNVVIQIKGERTWLRVTVDGEISPQTGVGGKVFAAGKTLRFTGKELIELRTGKENTTYLIVNGTEYGALGKVANPGSWRIEPGKPPVRTSGR
ncbi:MAG: transcriptional regulator, family [Chloroflexi bacterium]|nr:transcriptional regulator, family [Chloroflexota bacterium]